MTSPKCQIISEQNYGVLNIPKKQQNYCFEERQRHIILQIEIIILVLWFSEDFVLSPLALGTLSLMHCNLWMIDPEKNNIRVFYMRKYGM